MNRFFLKNYTLFNLKVFSALISNGQILNILDYLFLIPAVFNFVIVFTNADK